MTRLVAKSATREAARKHGLKVVEQSETTEVSSETAAEQQSEQPHERLLATAYQDEAARRSYQRQLAFLEIALTFPWCFFGAPLLAEDIIQQIIAARLKVPPQAIADALRTWMLLPGYLHKVVDGAPSINLDGSPAGFPSDAARADAAALLAENGGER